MQDEIEGAVTGRRAERVVAATREPGRRRVVVRRPRLRLERSDQRLRALGIVPDVGRFEFALNFDQTFGLGIEVKDTPVGIRNGW